MKSIPVHMYNWLKYHKVKKMIIKNIINDYEKGFLFTCVSKAKSWTNGGAMMLHESDRIAAALTFKQPFVKSISVLFSLLLNGISSKIFTWLCCYLACWDYVISSQWFYKIPYSSGLLHWNWGNPMIAQVPEMGKSYDFTSASEFTQKKIWVKLNSSKLQHIQQIMNNIPI